MEISVDFDLDKRCGEVFLTTTGDFFIHCTVCQTKFYAFSEYADHIHDAHIFPKYEVEYIEDFEIDDRQSIGDATETATTLISKEDLVQLEQLEFSAPEPDCKEIEDFVRNFSDAESKKGQTQFLDNSNKRSVRKRVLRNNKTSIAAGVLYSCPYCDATSHSRKSMNEHKLRHKGVLRHKCDTCAKAFFSSSELAVHVRTHTGVRPFLCSDCGHKCTTASALKTHIKSCRDIRDAKCEICNKMFRSDVYLRRHMIAHSSERAFSCATCNAKFKQKKALQSHFKIHENLHGYKCDKCPASFNQRPGLYSHLKSKHNYVIKTL